MIESPVRILGLDPGLAALGWGVIDIAAGRPVHVAHGCVRTAPGAEVARAAEIVGKVDSFLAIYHPTAVVAEAYVAGGYDRRAGRPSQASSIGVARVVGELAGLARARSLPWAEYPAAVWKPAILGRARDRAPRQAEQHAIRLRCGVWPRTDHAACALGVALYHAGELRLAMRQENAR